MISYTDIGDGFSMTYYGSVDYKLNFPCIFQDDSYDNLEIDLMDYLYKAIDNNPITVDYGNVSISSYEVEDYSGNDYAITLKFTLECDAYDDEDVFISENSEIVREFISIAEDNLNELLAGHDVAGYLPEDKDVIFDGDSVYVRLAYHQDNVRINLEATTVSFDDDVDDVLSDTFYSV